INKENCIIEIGTRIDSLTEQLAIHAKDVLAFEIDQRLNPILQDTLEAYDNVTVVNEDILKVDLNEAIGKYFSPDLSLHIVANLPYYITTPILMRVLEQ